MHPEFFSEFPSYVTGWGKMKTALAENIDCYEVHNVDQKFVEYSRRINGLSGFYPPFDPVKFAERLGMVVSYDDFEATSKMFGYLYPPRWGKYNPSDSFKISINNRLEGKEKRFTVAHEIAERLIGFNKLGEVQVIGHSTIFDNEYRERTCDKIAREIVIPSSVFVHDFRNLNDRISLKSGKSLSDLYSTPLSQTIIKLNDLEALNAALYDKENNILYGKRELIIDEPIPVCQLMCSDCEKKISEIKRRSVASAIQRIENGEKIKGVLVERWKENPLSISENPYWIAYKEEKGQAALI
jgi:Zn-dependent peptidase ImmA (M78 family)